MYGKIICLSFTVCILAIFVTLDIFIPYREKINAKIPPSFKNYIHDITGVFGLSWIFDGNSAASHKLFSKSELEKYEGSAGSNIYISLLGHVYDVTRGRKHYGPDGGYHGFAGRDATRAFITGDFTTEGLIEDISDLSPSDVLGLDGWLKFYEKDYKYVGKLIGHFYDKDGHPTGAMKQYLQKLSIAKSEKEKDKGDARIFPPCNSEWRQNSGTHFWCTTLSGGIQRDWVGVPRQYFQPGKPHPRCACVRTTGPPSGHTDSEQHSNRGDLDNPQLKLYSGCDPDSVSCYLP